MKNLMAWIGLVILTTAIALAQSAPAKVSRPDFTGTVVGLDLGNTPPSWKTMEAAKKHFGKLGVEKFAEGSNACLRAAVCVRYIMTGNPQELHRVKVLIFETYNNTTLGQAQCTAEPGETQEAIKGGLAKLLSDNPFNEPSSRASCTATWLEGIKVVAPTGF
jgi:hypothetical protein